MTTEAIHRQHRSLNLWMKFAAMHWTFAISLVFLGCCSNVIFLELIVREAPQSGNIITFAQFAFIAIEGFFFTTKCGTQKPIVPMSTYVVMVTLFFITSVVNNICLGLNIPLPLHMIFRAGSLMASLVLGVIILKRSYPFFKYISVLMITVGIIVSTIASSDQVGKTGKSDDDSAESRASWDFVLWMSGIVLLTFALFMAARMGIYQETVYAKHGKHPREALFYNHALPLPFFVIFYKNIYEHVIIYNNSLPLTVPVIGIDVPRLWIYLAMNVLTQYVCIRAVFQLTTECTALVVTLIVTLRKFVSLIFSIVYFQNPFTTTHMFGTALVFGGTLIFTEVPSKLATALFGKKKQQ